MIEKGCVVSFPNRFKWLLGHDRLFGVVALVEEGEAVVATSDWMIVTEKVGDLQRIGRWKRKYNLEFDFWIDNVLNKY